MMMMMMMISNFPQLATSIKLLGMECWLHAIEQKSPKVERRSETVTMFPPWREISRTKTVLATLPETNIASKNRPSQKEIHLPIIDFQERTASFRECTFFGQKSSGFSGIFCFTKLRWMPPVKLRVGRGRLANGPSHYMFLSQEKCIDIQ